MNTKKRKRWKLPTAFLLLIFADVTCICCRSMHTAFHLILQYRPQKDFLWFLAHVRIAVSSLSIFFFTCTSFFWLVLICYFQNLFSLMKRKGYYFVVCINEDTKPRPMIFTLFKYLFCYWKKTSKLKEIKRNP